MYTLKHSLQAHKEDTCFYLAFISFLSWLQPASSQGGISALIMSLGVPRETTVCKGEALLAIERLNCQSWGRAVSMNLFLSYVVCKWYSLILLKHFLNGKIQIYTKVERNEAPRIHHPTSAMVNLCTILFCLYSHPSPPPNWIILEQIQISYLFIHKYFSMYSYEDYKKNNHNTLSHLRKFSGIPYYC